MDMLDTKSCLSDRQIERQSLQRIGLSPKYFSRTVRFLIAYEFKESNPKTSWSEIAHQFGYEDICNLYRISIISRVSLQAKNARKFGAIQFKNSINFLFK